MKVTLPLSVPLRQVPVIELPPLSVPLKKSGGAPIRSVKPTWMASVVPSNVPLTWPVRGLPPLRLSENRPWTWQGQDQHPLKFIPNPTPLFHPPLTTLHCG